MEVFDHTNEEHRPRILISRRVKSILLALIFFFVIVSFISLYARSEPRSIGGGGHVVPPLPPLESAFDIEQRIRNELQIPDNAKKVLIISQGAHLDWDWLNVFTTNVNNTPMDAANYFHSYDSSTPQPSNNIFSAATKLLTDNPKYYYSICETAFLKGLADTDSETFQQMKTVISRVRTVGGGMASPDNLLPSGESLFRNYLVGVNWLQKQGIEWSQQAWVPDDFGHDSEFPIIMQAMGVQGVGFARVPGACDQGINLLPKPTAATVLLDRKNGGVDFIWKAADGSKVFAHWLQDHYSQGRAIYQNGEKLYSTPEETAQCTTANHASGATEHLKSYIGANQPVSPTPYIYVHSSDDFMMPNLLVDAADDWNSLQFNETGVYVVVATFDHYVRLANAYNAQQPQSLFKVRNFHGNSPNDSFVSSPYWMGYYASRPALKLYHHLTSRSLLAAETFSLLLGGSNTLQRQNEIDDIWMYMVPSTHHDFITGTATDYVYENEQLGRSEEAAARANSTRDKILRSIASSINLKNTDLPNLSAPNVAFQVVFNQNGFGTKGIVEIPNSATQYQQYKNIQQSIQVAANNSTTLMYVTAPSMGYNTFAFSKDVKKLYNDDITPASITQVSATATNQSFLLENKFLKAFVNQNDTWMLRTVIDKATGKNMLANDTLSNQITFVTDNGNIYRFGFELGLHCAYQRANQFTWEAKEAKIIEKGPLRVVLSTTVLFNMTNSSGKPEATSYTILYSLYATEPMLRISIEGKALRHTTITTQFKFAKPITQFEHGTPYHWTWKSPQRYGDNLYYHNSFEAVHDFAVLYNNNTMLGAIYHSGSMPAWSINDNGEFVGVLFRNTPGGGCAGYGAEGKDDSSHIQQFAIRIPTGLSPANTGLPLIESRAYNTPLIGVIAANSSGNRPLQNSVASISAGPGIITVAKVGSMKLEDSVFRIYQPTNKPVEISVSINGVSQVRHVASFTTALEREMQWPGNAPTISKDGMVHLEAQYAVTTLTVSPQAMLSNENIINHE